MKKEHQTAEQLVRKADIACLSAMELLNIGDADDIQRRFAEKDERKYFVGIQTFVSKDKGVLPCNTDTSTTRTSL